MQKNVWTYLCSILLVVLTLNCAVQNVSKAQLNQQANTGVKVNNDSSTNSAKVNASLQQISITDYRIETVLSYPMPDMWLTFACNKGNSGKETCGQEDLRVELSSEVKNKIREYWKDSLTFRYNTLVKVENFEANRNNKLSSEFSSVSQNFAEGLKQIRLDLPNEQRSLTTNEVDDIMRFINEFSLTVIEQAKASQK